MSKSKKAQDAHAVQGGTHGVTRQESVAVVNDPPRAHWGRVLAIILGGSVVLFLIGTRIVDAIGPGRSTTPLVVPAAQPRQEDKEPILQQYYAVMAAMRKDPPASLNDAMTDLGRRPDECKRANENLDVCWWSLSSDRTIAVGVFSLNKDNTRAGSDPQAWVKRVVFTRGDNVETRIDGAMQQLIDKVK